MDANAVLCGQTLLLFYRFYYSPQGEERKEGSMKEENRLGGKKTLIEVRGKC